MERERERERKKTNKRIIFNKYNCYSFFENYFKEESKISICSYNFSFQQEKLYKTLLDQLRGL